MAYKQSPFPRIAGTSSPVKSKAWLAKQALKYGKKVYKFAKSKLTKPTKKENVFVKHDPKSGHLRFKTGYSSQGGKPTGEFIAVSGEAGGKLTLDPLRKSYLPKGMDIVQASKIAKGMNRP